MTLKVKEILLLLCFASMSNLLCAQISHGEQPRSWALPVEQLQEVQRITMPEVDTKRLLQEDSEQTDKAAAFRFGYAMPVSFIPASTGTWTELENGDRIWQLELHCPEANSINLMYDKFYLPLGSRFHIYSRDREQLLGAFTHANNKSSGKFATGIIAGSNCTIEYYEPKEVANQARIEISSVVHGYRDYHSGFEGVSRGYNDSGNCNNNVNCPEAQGWERQISSVAMIIYEGFRLCSGAMLNNTNNDCKPYFLSANHCYSATQLPQWMFVFNYESPTCASQNASISQSIVGCQLKAKNSDSDFLLVELSAEPPPDYNVFLSGWSRSTEAATEVVCIHHPSGDIKKISYDQQSVVEDIPFWKVNNWGDGTTESGSSGAPLYDQNQRIVGHLQGGTASCVLSGNPDFFGQFHRSWNGNGTTSGSLFPWLGANDPNSLSIDGLNCGNADRDASISEIVIPTEVFCSNEIVSRVVIENSGAVPIESLSLAYSFDGEAAIDYEWTGFIDVQETGIISLPQNYRDNGSHSLTVAIEKVNGGTDQQANNNVLSQDFEIVTGPDFETCLLPPTESLPGILEIKNLIGTSPFNIAVNGETPKSNFIEVHQGSYMIAVQDGNACKKTKTIDVSNQITVCANTDIDLAKLFCIPEKGTVSWRIPGALPKTIISNLPIVKYPNPGTYDLTVTIDGQERFYPNYMSVVESFDFALSFEHSTESENSGTASVNILDPDRYSFDWFNLNANTQSVENLAQGQYQVAVTSLDNGCRIVQSFNIFGPDKSDFKDDAGFFPNPVAEQVNFYNFFQEDLQIEIFDMAGQNILQANSSPGVQSLDLSLLSPGIYILKMNTTNFEKIEKLYLYK